MIREDRPDMPATIAPLPIHLQILACVPIRESAMSFVIQAIANPAALFVRNGTITKELVEPDAY